MEPDGTPTMLFGWQPAEVSYYGGELILEPLQRLSLEQRLEMLDTHPLFTGFRFKLAPVNSQTYSV
jgi:hypothetical protein